MKDYSPKFAAFLFKILYHVNNSNKCITFVKIIIKKGYCKQIYHFKQKFVKSKNWVNIQTLHVKYVNENKMENK